MARRSTACWSSSQAVMAGKLKVEGSAQRVLKVGAILTGAAEAD